MEDSAGATASWRRAPHRLGENEPTLKQIWDRGYGDSGTIVAGSDLLVLVGEKGNRFRVVPPTPPATHQTLTRPSTAGSLDSDETRLFDLVSDCTRFPVRVPTLPSSPRRGNPPPRVRNVCSVTGLLHLVPMTPSPRYKHVVLPGTSRGRISPGNGPSTVLAGPVPQARFRRSGPSAYTLNPKGDTRHPSERDGDLPRGPSSLLPLRL